MEIRDLFALGIPISMLFLLRRKYQNPFFTYVLVGLLAEMVGLTSALLFPTDNVTLLSTVGTNTYAAFETTTYYSYLIARTSKFQRIYKIAFLFSIIWTIIIISYLDPFLYDFWPFSINSLLLMFMGLLGYYEMLSAPEVTDPLKSSFFWINSAFFFFGASSTIIFLFIDSGLREEFNMMANLWIVGYGIVSSLRYIFIGIGVYQKDMIT